MVEISSVKIGIRSLLRGKLKTAFTICAVALGVSLVVSINISAESMNQNVINGFSEQLGYIDIILKENRTYSSFNYNKMSLILDNIDSIDMFVPRLTVGRTVRTNASSTINAWGNIIGINVTHPAEQGFGSIKVIKTYEAYHSYTKIEQFLAVPGNSCVISVDLAELYNLSVGDSIYLPALNMGLLGQTWSDTSTWGNFTIQAIIIDGGEATNEFTPPASNYNSLDPPSRGIYLAMDDAYNYVFNTYGENVSYIYVHASDTTNIEKTMNDIYTALQNSVDFGHISFYQANYKEQFATSISETMNMLNLMFIVLSFMGMLVCAILIKNLMEMNTQSQIYEIGILRAIGTGKNSIFKIFIFQILFISMIGTIIGLLLGVGLSYLFIDVMSNIISETNFLYTFDQLQIYKTEIIITQTPFISGTLSGILIPLLFGFLPVIKASKINVIEALQGQRSEVVLVKAIKAIKYFFKIVLSLGLIIIGYYCSNYGFSNLFTIHTDFVEIKGIIYILFGLVGIIFGVLYLTITLFPIIAMLIVHISVWLLGNLRTITYRNVLRNKLQTKNTLAMLSIGYSLMITISIILSSITAGAYPGLKTQFGGDILVGSAWGSMKANVNFQENLSKIENIISACPIREYVGKIDDFGMKTNSQGIIEDVRVYVVNITLYRMLLKDSGMFKIMADPEYDNSKLINFINGNDGFDQVDEILSSMEEGGKVIISNAVRNEINKDIQENVTIFASSIQKNLTVVGYTKVLPGLSELFWETSQNRLRAVALVSASDFPTLLTEGAFMITLSNLERIDQTILVIEDLYKNAGIIWSEAYVYKAIDYLETGVIVQLFMNIIQSIMVFTLFVSILGLVISMIMSINRRKTEIGIMRAIGSTRFQIIRIIFGETLVISSVGIFIGTISGILTATLMLINLGFMPFLPIIFTIPTEFIAFTSIGLLSLAISTAIIPVYSAMRIDIINSIKSLS